MSLLVAIHDVAPCHLGTVQRLRAALADWGVTRATLLAVPNYHGRGPLARSRETVAWLRARADDGDEICLHGHLHRQTRRIDVSVDRVRARLWTAGEGECLAQSGDERRHMLHEQRRTLEDALGRAVLGFVAPAWLEPRGFAHSLRAAGFRWHESGAWIERLGEDERRWRTPVIGFATRTCLRRMVSLAWARMLVRLPLAPARVALHPDDASSPAVMATAEAVVRRLGRTRACATYATALRISATRREVQAAL